MFVLAHLSDPHLPLPAAGAAELISKRFTGYLSWQMKRRHIHVPHALAAIVRDIGDQNPDHIALTGDIANISLPREFELASDWISSFAPPDRLTLVPGNHDCYVHMPWDGGLGRIAAYMQGDDAPAPRSAADFPFLRRRGEVALIGLSTAVPTLPLSARGALGAAQLARLDAMLADLANAPEVCRIILIHHPPHVGGAPWRKGIIDGAALRNVLSRRGADLVLHGHNHRNELGRLDGPEGAIPVLGVISASAAPDSPYGRGGWNQIVVRRDQTSWQFDVTHRCIDDGAQFCGECARVAILGPGSHARAAPGVVLRTAAEPAGARLSA